MKKLLKIEAEIEVLRSKLYTALDRNDSSQEIFNLSIDLDQKSIEHLKLKKAQEKKSSALK